jgi:hypothetical protein
MGGRTRQSHWRLDGNHSIQEVEPSITLDIVLANGDRGRRGLLSPSPAHRPAGFRCGLQRRRACRDAPLHRVLRRFVRRASGKLGSLVKHSVKTAASAPSAPRAAALRSAPKAATCADGSPPCPRCETAGDLLIAQPVANHAHEVDSRGVSWLAASWLPASRRSAPSSAACTARRRRRPCQSRKFERQGHRLKRQHQPVVPGYLGGRR